MLKQSLKQALMVLAFIAIFFSANLNLTAHDGHKERVADDARSHFQLDFGFKGFERLNRRLQTAFNTYDLKAGAIRYKAGMALAAPADADVTGNWSPVFELPVVAIQNAVLPTGKILMWDSVNDLPADSNDVHNMTRAIEWDPATGVATRYDVPNFNLFCAGFAALPDGRLFVAGGNLNRIADGLDKLHIFDPFNNSWNLLGTMSEGGRWYPSVTALSNGEMLITGGGPITPEVYNMNSGLRSLTTAVAGTPLYPWLQAAPNGRTLYFGPDDTINYLDTAGTGAWEELGGRDGIYRTYGSYAMFDIGKILVTGGYESQKESVVIDANGMMPQVSQTDDMAFGRRQHNLTVLPDGTVLATGGNSSGAALLDLAHPVNTAELWNPQTGEWKVLSAMQRTRQYHSMALLMPDGRVLVGGGGICADCYEQDYLEKNIEIYSPPYLFAPNGGGVPAARPTITDAPETIGYGEYFRIYVDTPKRVKKAVLMRPASVTHSVNFEQRRIPIPIQIGKRGMLLNAPTSSAIAPPGYYMLFVLNDKGVPSVAKMVKLGPASN